MITRSVTPISKPPAALAFEEEEIKVTLALSKRSVAFFKAEARKRGTPYQRMIRRLVDAYVDGQKKQPRTRRGAEVTGTASSAGG